MKQTVLAALLVSSALAVPAYAVDTDAVVGGALGGAAGAAVGSAVGGREGAVVGAGIGGAAGAAVVLAAPGDSRFPGIVPGESLDQTGIGLRTC